MITRKDYEQRPIRRSEEPLQTPTDSVMDTMTYPQSTEDTLKALSELEKSNIETPLMTREDLLPTPLMMRQDLLDKEDQENQDANTLKSISDEVSTRSPASKNNVDTDKPPVSKEEDLLKKLQELQDNSDKELQSAKSADKWLSLANSLNSAFSRFDQASALKATKIPNLKSIDPGVVASTSEAKDVLAERSAKINELLNTQKLKQALSPKQPSALDMAKIKELEAKAASYGSKASSTEGEKTRDREFAKEYNKWSTGGKADYEESKKIFQETLKGLKSGKLDTGWDENIKAGTTSLAGGTTDAINAENRIRKALNSMLRATLGSQFTEEEGERIFKQTFNIAAPPEENIKNIETELNKIEGRKKAIEAQGAYLKKNKTLAGFELPDSTTQKPEEEIKTKVINGKQVNFRKTAKGWEQIL